MVDVCAMPYPKVIKLSNDYRKLSTSVSEIMSYLPPLQDRMATRIAITEGVANAIIHGVLRVTPRGEDGDPFEFARRLCDANEHQDGHSPLSVTIRLVFPAGVEVEIHDAGPGFAWREHLARPGRGMALIREVAAAVCWNESGSAIRMTFSCCAKSIEHAKSIEDLISRQSDVEHAEPFSNRDVASSGVSTGYGESDGW